MTRLTIGLSTVLFCMPLSAREWTDSTGKYKIEAELLKVEPNRVQLKKTDGAEVWVPMTKLSRADRAFVESQSPKTPAGTAAPAGLKTKGSARWSNMTRMDSDGKPLPPELEVRVTVTGKRAVDAVAFGNLKIDSITAANGKPLEPADSFHLEELLRGFTSIERGGMFDNHPKNGILVAIPVKAAQGTKLIGGAKGSVTLKTGGKRHSVVVKDAAKQIDKPINDKTLDAAKLKVTIKKVEDRQVELLVVGDQSSVTKLSVVDAAGKEIGENIASTGWDEEFSYTLQSEKALPPDAAVRIEVATGLQDVVVPFSFEKLKVEEKKTGGMFGF